MIDRRNNRNQVYTQLDAGYGSPKPVDTPKDAPNDKPNAGSYYGTYASFKPSAAYKQAMAYTNGLLEKINSVKTSYTDKINAIMGQIENREKFSYDFNTDPLFQNALQGAMSAGATAMQDTMGQASALTGGYGSSYATSAANQAYNEHIKGAYDNLPEYYNLAKSAYDQEGQELYDRLGMYRTADESEFSRLNNAYALNLANAESIYGKEYNNYWDSKKFNEDSRRWAAEMGLKAQQYADSKNQWEREFTAKNAQWKMEYDLSKNSAKTSGGGIGYSISSDDRKALIEMVKAKGSDNPDVLDFGDRLVEKGADLDDVWTLINLYNEAPNKFINANGVYEDQYGKTYGDATLSLQYGKEGKEGSVYVDPQTGKAYTWKTMVESGLTPYTETERAKSSKNKSNTAGQIDEEMYQNLIKMGVPEDQARKMATK